GEIDARGVMGRPETLHLQVSSFKATAGESDVSGSLTLENLRDPLVQADLRSSNLDVDDFLPRRHQPAERDRPMGRAEPGALDRTDGQIVVTVAAGRAK